MNFEIQLPLFKGPFDLLLFFIERDELDIHDIPISKITDDFLDYIHQLEKLNIEVASEFILVAATLMRIKAKMLLPRPVMDETGKEIDPREELVAHLLEYKKYKSVVSELASLEELSMQREKRGNIAKELKTLAEISNVEAELQDIDLYKLLKVYEKVMNRFVTEKNKPVHQVIQYPYTIEEKKEYILRKVNLIQKVSFIDIVKESKEKIEVIYTFLAILELLQWQKIMIFIGEGYNNFWIEKFDEAQVLLVQNSGEI
ncbi:MAG: segregation/condensation protein A [Cytophagaceae bacterium]|nr:segregation/condensation protein A [Cytophagaceae bacterium]MDW8457042.1 segregation/condensation protein A [Cytophagaceae bacterium]